jgi:hypothetical protein
MLIERLIDIIKFFIFLKTQLKNDYNFNHPGHRLNFIFYIRKINNVTIYFYLKYSTCLINNSIIASYSLSITMVFYLLKF